MSRALVLAVVALAAPSLVWAAEPSETACKTAADCVVVRKPCCSAGCMAVNKQQEPKVRERVTRSCQAKKCAPPDPVDEATCELEATCVDGLASKACQLAQPSGCKADKDCEVVKTGCCGGGCSVMTRAQATKHRQEVLSKCVAVDCAGPVSDGPDCHVTPACVEGKCQANSPR